MSTPSELEARVGALISAYADRAPTFVDPVGMTRLAAETRMHLRATRRQSIWPERGLAAMLTAVALLVVVVLGTVIVGAQLIRDDPLAVIGRDARLHVGWVFVYSDGRVVGANGAYLFERSLTPEGLELIRSGAVPSSAILDDPRMSGSIISPRLVPQVLGPLLPDSAWADPDVHPYQPTDYAVCAVDSGHLLAVDDAFARLPDAAQAILRGNARRSEPEAFFSVDVTPESPGAGCSAVGAADARRLVNVLVAEGFNVEVNPEDGILEPGSPGGRVSKAGVAELQVQPVLPNGTWMPWGG